MGSCALIGFGNTERNFGDGLMVVKEDNGVDAEIHLFILQVFTLIWLPSVNNPRAVKMWSGEEGTCYGEKKFHCKPFLVFISDVGLFGMLSCIDTRSGAATTFFFGDGQNINCSQIRFFTAVHQPIKTYPVYTDRRSFWKCQKPAFYSLASRDHQQQFQKRLKTTGCPYQKEAQNSYITVQNVLLVKIVRKDDKSFLV